LPAGEKGRLGYPGEKRAMLTGKGEEECAAVVVEVGNHHRREAPVISDVKAVRLLGLRMVARKAAFGRHGAHKSIDFWMRKGVRR